MIRPRTLVLSGVTHRGLEKHLFPGDGKEAAAILLCSRVERVGLKLLVRDVIQVPHKHCYRTATYLTWPGEYSTRRWLPRRRMTCLSSCFIRIRRVCTNSHG